MKPGREMDLEIARKLFHFAVIYDADKNEYFLSSTDLSRQWPVPRYTTKVEDSHLVIKRMSELGFQYKIESILSDEDGSLIWRATFQKTNLVIIFDGTSLSHAVGLAALFHASPGLFNK